MPRQRLRNVRAKKREQDYTAEQLIEQANIAIQRLQPDLAKRFYARALNIRPDDTNIMDALAEIHIQLGDLQEALQLLQQSVSLAPDVNVCKWLYLGQLQEGLEALQSYQRGIEFLTRESESTSPESPEWYVCRRHLCKTYCAIADLYLTDLCYEDGAEHLCEEAVHEALRIEPEALDAMQVQASLLISQQRKDEAARVASHIAQSFIRLRGALDVDGGEGGENKDETAEDVENGDLGAEDALEVLEGLGPEFPIETAKLLIECATTTDESEGHTQCAELAVDMLLEALLEDDTDTQTWYLVGVAALIMRPPDLETADHHLNHARQMLEQLQEECVEKAEPFVMEQQLALVHQHLAMLEGFTK